MDKIKRFAPHVVRVLLGLLFAFAGGSWFVSAILGAEGGEHTDMPFIAALVGSHYMMPLVKGTELIAALGLLSNRFVPLALALLAPVVVNISLFHFVLTPGHDTVLSILLPVALVYLAWVYRDAFTPMLAAKTKPA